MSPSPHKSRLLELRRERDIEVYERVELRAWSALRFGGLADLMIRCGSAGALQSVLDLLASHGISWCVLGSGSRLVFPDRGLRVPVLALGADLSRWELEIDGVVAGAGAKLTPLARAAARSGLAEVEELVGESGTVGGAVVPILNGRGRSCLEALLEWVEVLRPGAETMRLDSGSAHELCTLERGEGWLDRVVIVRARMRLARGELSVNHLGLSREELIGQSYGHALESAFLDPQGRTASEVLEDSGCRGLAVGFARVCENGGNRILTSRRVSSEDIVELCRAVRRRVWERLGVVLEPALDFVDEHGRRFRP